MSRFSLLPLKLADLGWESNGTGQLLLLSVHDASSIVSQGSLLLVVIVLGEVERIGVGREARPVDGLLLVGLPVLQLGLLDPLDLALLLRLGVHESRSPDVLQSQLKGLVSVHTGRDAGVVLDELVGSHVWRILIHQGVVCLEGLHELVQDTLLSPDALDDIGMARHIEGGKDPFLGHLTILSELESESLESFDGSSLSGRWELTLESGHELEVVDGTVTILIEGLEQGWDVLLGNRDSVVLADLDELRKRKTGRAIVVHDVEEPLETDDTSGSTSLELVFEKIQERLGRIFSSCDVGGKLSALLLNVGI